MYAAGQPHPRKRPCAEVLALVAAQPQAFFTDAEVLQELLHRYLALHVWPQGRSVFQRFATLMRQRVEPVYEVDVESAAALADQHSGLSARDLLHVAVMLRVGATQLVSTDHGFDNLPRIMRLDPANLAAWRQQVQP